MMEPEEQCLSEVHTELSYVASASVILGYNCAVTQLNCRYPTWLAITDDDGDATFIHATQDCTINMKHCLATRLVHVGLQIWPASLALSDFVIHMAAELRGSVVLDVGAGLGLTSLVASLFSRITFATDIGDEILKLLNENIAANAKADQDIRARWLDWNYPFQQDSLGSFRFREDEIFLINNNCTHILAADVVYDIDATSALFKLLKVLQNQSSCQKTVWIAIERRLNFTIEDMEVSCPAFEHFMKCLAAFNLIFRRINLTEVPSVMLASTKTFERSKYMELYEILLPSIAK